MKEKESVMIVRCEPKIQSLGITFRHHSASLVMPNSYPRDGIFNPHLTTIKVSYILFRVKTTGIKSFGRVFSNHSGIYNYSKADSNLVKVHYR